MDRIRSLNELPIGLSYVFRNYKLIFTIKEAYLYLSLTLIKTKTLLILDSSIFV